MPKKPNHPAEKKAGPQHQAAEDHGTVKAPQLDGTNAENTARGSEGDRRRASNMQR